MNIDMLGMDQEGGRARRAFPNSVDEDLLNAGVRQEDGSRVRRPKPLKQFGAGYFDRRDLPRLDPRRLDSEGVLQAMSLEQLENRVARRHGLRPQSTYKKKILTAPRHKSGAAKGKTWKQMREDARSDSSPRMDRLASEATSRPAWETQRAPLAWEAKIQAIEAEATEEDRQLTHQIEDELRENWAGPKAKKKKKEKKLPEASWGSFPPDKRPGQVGGSQLGFDEDEELGDVDEDEEWDTFQARKPAAQIRVKDDDDRRDPLDGKEARPQVVGTGANLYLRGPPKKKKRKLEDWLLVAKPRGRRQKKEGEADKDDKAIADGMERFQDFQSIDDKYRNKRKDAKKDAKYAKIYRAVMREVLPLPWETVEGRKSWTDRDDKNWKDLGLDLAEDLKVQRRLEKFGIVGPNKLQAAAIPAVFSGRDIILTAMTGCGKTLAFLMPILHKYVFPTMGERTMRQQALSFAKKTKLRAKVWSQPKVLITAPSRELAIQTWRIVRDLLKPFPMLNVSLLMGDSQVKRQDEDLKNEQPVIVVGSPGRILDHALEGRLSFRGLRCVVFDEIDRLLNNSRTDHMEIITALLKKEAKPQTVLVSATLSKDIPAQEYAKKHLVSYRTVGPAATMEMPPRVLHLVNGAPGVVKKLMFLRRLHTSTPIPNGVLVFVNSHDRARKVDEQLKQMKIPSRMLSANCSAQRRGRAIRDMDAGDIDMLVATDVATRGIDFRGLTHVVNFDIPSTSLIYAHRAGRCGRHGRNGIVISLGGGGAENNRLSRYAEELDIELHEANVESQMLGLCESRDMARVGTT